MTQENKELTEVARAIWSVLQWSEDKLDTELADLPTDHEVWKMASVAMMAMQRTAKPAAQEQDKERAQPVAWQERQRIVGGKWGDWYDIKFAFGQAKGARTEVLDTTEYEWRPLYAAPQPNAALADGWISVDERLPEDGVEVLCAGVGWGEAFVMACYYDEGRREWYPINTHWTDATGNAQYPTHWRPLPAPPTLNASKGRQP